MKGIIRGQDLTDSTGRQILLGEMLGREKPATFLHHPLVLNEDGTKLSKRQYATSIASLREQGMKPEGLLGELAFQSGLRSQAGNFSARHAGELFQ